MEISAALVANGAMLDDGGLLNIMGGGWEFVAAPSLPWTIAGHVAGVVEFGAEEIGSRPTLRLTVEPEGHDAGSLGSITVDAIRHRAAFHIPFALVATQEDLIVATISGQDGIPLATLTFPIRLVEPAPESASG